MMRHAIAAALAVFVVGIGQANAGANLISNGSFEDGPSDADPRWNAGQWISLGLNLGGFNDIGHWTVDPLGQIDLLRSGSFYGDASDGVRHIDLTGSPVQGKISQTISTVVGQAYQVSFDLLGIYGLSLGGPTGVRSQLAGGGIFADFTPSLTDNGWETKQWTFTATGTSTTLEFASLFYNEFGNGPHIDNVRVTEVPEPSSVIVFGIGFSVLSAFGWKKRSLAARSRQPLNETARSGLATMSARVDLQHLDNRN